MKTREPIVLPVAGEPLRFLVRSRSRPSIRLLVDLQENWCGCEDHQFRKRRCWHLQQARDYLLDQILARLAKQLEQKAA